MAEIRMDCSSPYAMTNLVALRDRFQVAFGNDPDSDRHGIVTPSAGLMNPNHYLAVAIRYLLGHRPQWPAGAAVGKTLVSGAIINRVVADLGRRLWEVPVGFKWFSPGLFNGSCCFGGEESARGQLPPPRRHGLDHRQGRPAVGPLGGQDHRRTGLDPGKHYRRIAEQFGDPLYTRIDAPASPQQKARLKQLAARSRGRRACRRADPGQLDPGRRQRRADRRAEDRGPKRLVCGAAVRHGNVYKLYAESFKDQAHLDLIVGQARQLVAEACRGE